MGRGRDVSKCALYAVFPPLGNGKKVLAWGGSNPEPLLSGKSALYATHSCAVLGTIPQSFCWRCVSLQKDNWYFFGTKRRCITLEHSIRPFCCLGESSDCRSDLAPLSKKSASFSPSLFNAENAGEGSEPVYPSLRNVVFCSPGLDAGVLQRDLDAPLVPMALAAFHGLCCQTCSRPLCCPAPGSFDVSPSAGVPHHKAGACNLTAGKLKSITLMFSLRWALRPHQRSCYTEQLQTKAWHLRWLVTSTGLD